MLPHSAAWTSSASSRSATERRGDPKITLVELHTRFRGQNVDAIVERAIQEHLDHRTYNNIGDLKDALRDLKIRIDPFPPHIEQGLIAMMARRHQIAHRADVASTNPHDFRHIMGVSPILFHEIDSWLIAVESLGCQILDQFQEAA